jgi:hypothetical protein
MFFRTQPSQPLLPVRVVVGRGIAGAVPALELLIGAIAVDPEIEDGDVPRPLPGRGVQVADHDTRPKRMVGHAQQGSAEIDDQPVGGQLRRLLAIVSRRRQDDVLVRLSRSQILVEIVTRIEAQSLPRPGGFAKQGRRREDDGRRKQDSSHSCTLH